ncbi:MAG TPA: hypothetical protein VE954_33755 [Oligoflexus sp.]|uniref:hypothetical protein n=1 Tax=Oligoflexus sp. TaxID=1971216 RepID=UPI002D6D75B9|nr:hypothetical protein [Oligoflexus sp.]HYX38092.1 hypothetical protein [Oligoflexus sp.]
MYSGLESNAAELANALRIQGKSNRVLSLLAGQIQFSVRDQGPRRLFPPQLEPDPAPASNTVQSLERLSGGRLQGSHL